MAEKRYRAGKSFNKLLRPIVGAYMRTLFALSIEILSFRRQNRPM